MIIYLSNSDLLDCTYDCIVNTINCVGIMGAGLALQFKNKYPEYYKAYKKKCNQGLLDIGVMDIYHYNNLTIIGFPTKADLSPSKIEYIEKGLYALRKELELSNIKSIGIPKLGCGLGGLMWDHVKPLIESILKGTVNSSGKEILIYIHE